MKGKNKNIQGFLLFLLFLMVIYIWSTLRSNNIEKNGIYLIAYVDKIEGARSGLQLYYHFYYQGKKYESNFISGKEKEELKSKRYYIKVLPNNIDKIRFYTDKPVPSCIKAVPFDGWETIPTKCDD